MKKKVLIIGGGAAGFFCAAQLHHPFLDITIIEKTSKLLSKVKVSGGGRCNVTNNSHDTIPEFVKSYPRGQNHLKKAFYNFSFIQTMDWFEQKGVSLKTESDGRVFPVTNDSQTIIDCLIHEVEKNHVKVLTNTVAQNIIPQDKQYLIETNRQSFTADYVIIATGGYPKLEHFNWLQNLQLKISPPVPSLFTFNLPKHPITALMGVAAAHTSVKIVGEKIKTEGPLLITHWGLSGPAILKASAWGANVLADKQWHFNIHINWIEPYTEEALRIELLDYRQNWKQKYVHSKNPFSLPNRLWEFLLQEIDISADQHWHDLSNKSINKLINQLIRYECVVKGKTTFKEEFVTAGGIELSEITPQTMELRRWPHIYILGEAMNVDGITGGYNFQNAWTSAYTAAKHILQSL